MDRELVLVFLALVIAGPAVLACGWWPRRAAHAESARRSEHAAWNRIWTPLVPAGLAVGALLGWAIVEPADAELIALPYALAAMPFAVLFARVVPNLKRLGLLTPRVRQSFEQLGILEYEDADPEAEDRALGLA